MLRKLLMLAVAMVMMVSVVWAQDDDLPSTQRRVLVSGVDINGQGFPLVVVDLAGSTARTLATFAHRPVCRPSVYADGEKLLYELIDPASSLLRAYQVDVNTGERNAIAAVQDMMLTCPVVAPDNSRIAWLQTQTDEHGEHVGLVLTDIGVVETTTIATHSQIFDVQWSPGSGALVYHVMDAIQPYPSLYSLPRDGATEPRLVWRPGQGILHDYIWAQNSSGLLVAYYTEEYLGIALLASDCVIGPGDACEVVPLVTFPPQASVSLLNAFSPIARRSVISLQVFDPVTQRPRTDLWILDLTGQSEPEQLTFSADIIETDAYWLADGKSIYYIATYSDAQTRTLRGGVYLAEVGEARSHVQVFESTVFLPSAFLRWYE